MDAMGRYLFIGAALLAGFSAAPAQSQAQMPDDVFGIWRNAEDDVHIRTAPCGDQVCGVVVWASESAKEDSKRGGTPNLVGTSLFHDFKQVAANRWRGKVFIPDRGVTLSGTLSLAGRNTLRGTGCLVGRIFCQTQTWTRVE
jgi:uncharacterized protein (DUF2147 family)